MGSTTVEQTIRAVLTQEVRLSRSAETLEADADLFDLGMDSHGAVRVMLALEERLGLEFPEERLNRETFSSVDAIARALRAVEPAG